MTNRSPKTVFILGVEQRSGTNYLWQLLRLHPQGHVGSVGEDFLLEHSQFLKQYADRLYRSWIPKWRERMGGGSDPLLASIGDCLIAFIKKPYDLYPGEAASLQEKPSGSDFLSKTLITKSPSVKNLEHFFRLFPDAYLLLLVRDGRSVVESGMKSFGWTFEDAVRRWNRGARNIIEFVDHYRDSGKRFLLVRYEDLVSDTEATLRKVFTFLNFELDHYDFEAAKNLPIFGSSESKASEGDVHWNKVEKTERFAPLKRWDHWGRAQHERFNWLAGEAQAMLGYTTDPGGGNRPITRLKHRMLDWKWRCRERAAFYMNALRSIL